MSKAPETGLFYAHLIVLAAMPALQLQIAEFAREHGYATIGAAIKLTGASHNTLKQQLDWFKHQLFGQLPRSDQT